MIKSTLLFLTFFIHFSTHSQVVNEPEKVDSIDTIEVEPIYFVLGTLSDYMGHFYYVNKATQVDRYYPGEKPLVDYLVSYIKKELGIEVNTIFEKSNHSKMFSDELSKILNSFYGEKYGLDKYDLLDSKFETKKQIYSFLTGVYYRDGEKLDTSIYKIGLSNSPKHRNCYEMLKQIGCNKIFYKYVRSIPASYTIYFEPTDELKSYLEMIEPHRIILEESNFDEVVEMMKGQMTRKKLEGIYRKSRDEKLDRIKNAFEE